MNGCPQCPSNTTLPTRGLDEEGLFDVLQILAKGSWPEGDRSLGPALLQYVTRGKILPNQRRYFRMKASLPPPALAARGTVSKVAVPLNTPFR